VISLGVDPGLHATYWALVEHTGPKLAKDAPCRRDVAVRVKEVGVWRGDPKLDGEDAVLDMLRVIHWPPLTAAMPPCLDRIIVESQQVYGIDPKTGMRMSKGDPADLVRLATISGAVLKATRTRLTAGGTIRNPVPFDWKGNVEKVVPQARACVVLGWDYKVMGGSNEKNQYVMPTHSWFPGYSATDWKNLMDAIAMAIWGLKQ
jgi:hypothetical protein